MTMRAKSILRNPASNLLLISCLAWTLGLARASFALDEVNLHISAGVSGNALLYKFTMEKGFYREEGLDVRPIQAGMLPGIQGLVGGSFHFSQILGQGAGAILRGVPLKIVMVFDTRPLNWLFARKEIKSVQELKGGKQIAVSSFGAALDQMTRDLLPKRGIDPQKDVVLRASRTDTEPARSAHERRRRCGGGQSDGSDHRQERTVSTSCSFTATTWNSSPPALLPPKERWPSDRISFINFSAAPSGDFTGSRTTRRK